MSIRSQKPQYRADIDGLRAIAVLAILVYHAFPEALPLGFLGVDLFFVISGYLISSILFEQLHSGSFSLAEFYSRRIRRIFPSLFLVLLACGVGGWFLLLASEYDQLANQTLAAALFVANFAFWSDVGYFDPAAESKPLLHLWSLGVEEQFYIFFPLLLWVAYRRKLQLGRVVAVCGALSFSSQVYLAASSSPGSFYAPWARAWELMLGAWVAAMHMRNSSLEPQGRWGLAGLSREKLSWLGVLLLAALLGRPSPSYPLLSVALAAAPWLGAALLIAAGPDTAVARHLLGRPGLVWFGLISYALYLWHWPLLVFARVVSPEPPSVAFTSGLVVLSVLLAWVTTRFFERPWRQAGRAAQKVLALGILMAALAAAAVIVSAHLGYPERQIIKSSGELASANNREMRLAPPSCPGDESLPETLRAGCIVHLNPGAKKRVVVWGDSHAEIWRLPLVSFANTHNVELIVLSFPGCPPLAGVRRSDFAGATAHCVSSEASTQVMRDVISLRPDAVVMVARWPLYAHGWMRNGRLYHPTHFLTTDPFGDATEATSERALASQIPVTVSALRSGQIPVLVIFPPPSLRDTVTNTRKDLVDLEITRSEHEAMSRSYREVFGAIEGLSFIDPSERLCQERCTASLQGEPIYVDDNHLQGRATLGFYDDIERRLLRLLQ